MKKPGISKQFELLSDRHSLINELVNDDTIDSPLGNFEDGLLALIKSTVEKTIAGLKDSGLYSDVDYTIKDLAKELNISEGCARSITTGRYMVGTTVRYKKSEIDYIRSIGGKIETTHST